MRAPSASPQQALMPVHDLGIPVSLVLHVFEEADAKSMKRVEDRGIVICSILVDKSASCGARLRLINSRRPWRTVIVLLIRQKCNTHVFEGY